MSTKPEEDDGAWTVVDCFFKKYGFVHQQIQSYDSFIDNGLGEVIKRFAFVKVDSVSGVSYGVEFGNTVTIQRPTLENDLPLFPSDARLRKLTYSVSIYVDFIFVTFKTDKTGKTEEDRTVFPSMLLCKLPLMLKSKYCYLFSMTDVSLAKSKECIYDNGAYFIINGSEKVIISQERLRMNVVMVRKEEDASKGTVEWKSEIYSTLPDQRACYLVISVVFTSSKEIPHIVASSPFLKSPIPIFILFRALGFESDLSIFEVCVGDMKDNELIALLRPSLDTAIMVQTKKRALEYIGRSAGETTTLGRIACATRLLENSFLPHVVGEAYKRKKGLFLGYMVRRLFNCILFRTEVDDRDHFSNKRMDTAGTLIQAMFKMSFEKAMESFKTTLKKVTSTGGSVTNPTSYFKSGSITNALIYAFSTGNWGDKTDFDNMKVGVCQVLNRLTYASSLSHLRRFSATVNANSKDPTPRQLHLTAFGYMCPSETPEGHQVGIVKNMAMTCLISLGSDDSTVSRLFETDGMLISSVFGESSIKKTKVFLNGDWIGCAEDGVKVRNLIVQQRRLRKLDFSTSVSVDFLNLEVNICTDSGRCLRPLLVVSGGKLVLNDSHLRNIRSLKSRQWDYIMEQGIVEFLDASEEDCAMIAVNVQDLERRTSLVFTHCEIHCSLILGVCASIIPFSNHNQSPRVTYQSAMSKQAMGTYTSNFFQRMDTQAHVLMYPQKPLVTTHSMKAMQFDELPSGMNAVVAILSHGGYNQEDSLLMNQSSVDRGFMRSMYYRSYSDTEKKGPTFSNCNGSLLKAQRFERPRSRDCVFLKGKGHNRLDKDGLPVIGAKLDAGDVIIGKTSPLMECNGTRTRSDTSLLMKAHEHGTVDQVLLYTDEEGQRVSRVRIRSMEIPEVGDKFASRHGQKGTIGMMYRQEDLPFTSSGITPDIIINPHCIPSRMTVGQLLESCLGKSCSLSGVTTLATAFEKTGSSDLDLRDLGFQKYGNEVMYSGSDGLPLSAVTFIGVTYYQRLKHMVGHKMFCRSRGPVQQLCRQPTSGRSAGGGLRLGEMERDCFISHGAAAVLRDRFFFNSDPYSVHVCSRCGRVAIFDFEEKKSACRLCAEETQICEVMIPYSTKLLFQELHAMHIQTRLSLAKL